MENYREYCVVAVNRSKWGNTYKELFRGRRKDCRDFIRNYCNYEEENYYLRVGVCHWDVVIKQVKGDNSIYNTVDMCRLDKEDLRAAMDDIEKMRKVGMTRREIENKVMESIMSDEQKLIDFACAKDREHALKFVNFMVARGRIEKMLSLLESEENTMAEIELTKKDSRR